MTKRRVTRYSPDLVPLIRRYAEQGLVDEQIADNLRVHRSTLYAWAKAHPEVREALRAGKEIVDTQVENALLKRALGYEYTETEVITVGDGQPVRRKAIRKMLVPDVTAQIFWLKNRAPDRWRDRQHQVHTGLNGGPILHDTRGWSDDELRARIAALLKELPDARAVEPPGGAEAAPDSRRGEGPSA